MLILSRHEGEGIVIADNIKLTVKEIKHNSVRLGIEAPRDIIIRRAELPPTFPDKLQTKPKQDE